MPELPRKLARPTLALIPRVVDQLSFLYLDLVRIERDDNGVVAVIDQPDNHTRIYLPTASVAAFLLGPGTSITQPAAQQICRDGASILLTGASGVRTYGHLTHDNLTTEWLHRQATAWADPKKREATARRLYQLRFGDAIDVATLSIAQLRGMEGQRVKRVYQQLATKHGIKFRRNYDPNNYDSSDPVNQALTAGNAALYGIVHACITSIGCSPALGFIHTGNQRAFVYDIADLYKLETTVPLAFALRDDFEADKTIRWRFRDSAHLLKLSRRIVNNIQHCLDPGSTSPLGREGDDVDIVHLWDPAQGTLPSGTNYSNR